MKVTVLKIRSLMFILLLVLGVSLVLPLHRRIVSAAENMVNNLSSELYERTGLHFSYESLSPSILSTIYLKKIKFTDDNNNVILSINKTNIDYNLIKLLKRDFSDGFTNFVIDGIELDLDEILTIKTHLKKASEKKSAKKNLSNNSDSFDFEAFNQLIPKNVRLKNISLNF